MKKSSWIVIMLLRGGTHLRNGRTDTTSPKVFVMKAMVWKRDISNCRPSEIKLGISELRPLQQSSELQIDSLNRCEKRRTGVIRRC